MWLFLLLALLAQQFLDGLVQSVDGIGRVVAGTGGSAQFHVHEVFVGLEKVVGIDKAELQLVPGEHHGFSSNGTKGRESHGCNAAPIHGGGLLMGWRSNGISHGIE
eukprot:scaffold9465_cov45-Attheya_sp.AAC.3